MRFATVSKRNKPNIVLIVVDSARRERFGCYGYQRQLTPVIDSIARSGSVFERMISPASWTLPSHASMFTGLYPREHGAERPTYRMHDGIVTLAQHLHAHDYATAVFSNNRLISKETRLVDRTSEAFRRHPFDPATKRGFVHRTRILLGAIDRGADLANRAVDEFLRRRSWPFFIFLNYMECHGHYRPPRTFERRFVRRRFALVDSARHRLRMRGRKPWDGLGWTADERELLNDLYDASLAYVDDRIGILLEILKRAQAEETIIIVTSDHGENLGDHDRFGHDLSLDQTLIQVPFIARIPGQEPMRVRGLTQLTDLFVGLCGLIDIPIPVNLRDRPFTADPFRLRPKDAGRPYAFSESHEWEGKYLRRRMRKAPGFKVVPGADAVQDDHYKLLVERVTGVERLYDLQRDPGEQHDRLADLPEERRRLAHALEQWRLLCQPVGTIIPYTAEEERTLTTRLEELGYL